MRIFVVLLPMWIVCKWRIIHYSLKEGDKKHKKYYSQEILHSVKTAININKWNFNSFNIFQGIWNTYTMYVNRHTEDGAHIIL